MPTVGGLCLRRADRVQPLVAGALPLWTDGMVVASLTYGSRQPMNRPTQSAIA